MYKRHSGFVDPTGSDKVVEGAYVPQQIKQKNYNRVTEYSETCAANGKKVTLLNGSEGKVLHAMRDRDRELFLHIELKEKWGCHTIFVPISYVKNKAEVLDTKNKGSQSADIPTRYKTQVVELLEKTTFHKV